MSKTRSDSKLAPHEDFIFERLIDDNRSYQTVVDDLQKNGVDTSVSALSNYFRTHAWRWRSERSATEADAIKDALLKNNFAEAKAAAIAQREFELSVSNLSVKDLVALRNLALKKQALENDQRKIELQERRLQQAEAAEAVTKNEKLTPEEQQRKLKEIFNLQ